MLKSLLTLTAIAGIILSTTPGITLAKGRSHSSSRHVGRHGGTHRVHTYVTKNGTLIHDHNREKN